MARSPVLTIASVLAALLFATSSLANPPVDLSDPTARTVRLEIDSEVFDFARIGGAFSIPVAATFSSDGNVATVTMTGSVLEERIDALFAGLIAPIPGTFSDFVIRIDVATGDVLSIHSSGDIDTDIGLFTFQQSMTSLDTRGFLLVPVLGALFPVACVEGPQCTLVPGQPYDPATGQLVAVGDITGILNPIFSPFGDLRLSETAQVECDGAVNAAEFEVGDFQTYEFAMRNNGNSAQFMEAKVWLETPDGTRLSTINVGSDNSICLDTGDVFTSGPSTSMVVDTTVPVGSWAIGCRIVDPTTGETLAEDLDRFEVLGRPPPAPASAP